MDCLQIPEIPDLSGAEKVDDAELFRLPLKVPKTADSGGQLLVRTSRTLYFNRSFVYKNNPYEDWLYGPNGWLNFY
jgi:hypothetical protein